MTRGLQAAAQALLDKLDRIGRSEEYLGVFDLAAIRGMPYRGESHKAECHLLRVELGLAPVSMSVAMEIMDERVRQLVAKGYSPERDDAYQGNELARAAAVYAVGDFESMPRRRQLIKAAALLMAEIERLDRAATKGATTGRPPEPVV